MLATVQEIPSQCDMVLPQAVPYQAISISDKVESRDKEIIVSIPIQKGTFSNDIGKLKYYTIPSMGYFIIHVCYIHMLHLHIWLTSL